MTDPRTAPRAILRAAACVGLVLALVSCGDDGDVTTGDTTSTSAEVAPSTAPPGTTAAPAGTAVPTAISWVTPQVSLEAASLTITVGDQTFHAIPEGEVPTPSGPAAIYVHSDPGIPQRYTTLEVFWMEDGIETGLRIYFNSDGAEWWSNEIRTYDGHPSGEITYTGEFFRSPLGTAYTGDFAVEGVSAGVPTSLELPGLRLQAFLP